MTAETGKARTPYTYETIEYTHTEARVDDNGDGSYNVYQLLSVPLWNFSVFGTRHNTTTEVQWKNDNVVLTPAGGGTKTKYDRTVYRKVFPNYSAGGGAGALEYVDSGAGSTVIDPPAGSTTYDDANGETTHMGYVEYLGQDADGNDTWAGYNVQLTT